ncbi:hypothetical protein AX17_002391 [Amanita inopinata Kibby_2008]|nr:hypothetical protein AX17_002391 [Amanita inopinata Kibby_2008]
MGVHLPVLRTTLRKAYYTGGAGSHGTGPTPDALFSEGCIYVNRANNVVIVANAGSNTLTTFAISPTNPTSLTMIGSPVPSGGEFPASIVMNGKKTVCALNGGAKNGVSCFTLDRVHGLIPIPNTTRSLGLSLSTPPSGPANTVGQVAFTAGDSKLLVVVKGSSTKLGFIAMWDVNSDGSLSNQFQTMTGGKQPWSITPINGTNALLAADVALGVDIFDLGAYATNSSTQGVEVPISDAATICWTYYSPKVGNYYLSDFTGAKVFEMHIDSNLNPSIVKSYTTGTYAGNVEMSITTTPWQPDHLYVNAANITTIEVFTLQGPGNAQRIQELDLAAPAQQAGIHIDPDYIYGMATWTVV